LNPEISLSSRLEFTIDSPWTRPTTSKPFAYSRYVCILPSAWAGINEFIHGYKDEPKWIPYNRSEETEANPHRVEYLRSIGVGA
jgi:hypothetical protein